MHNNISDGKFSLFEVCLKNNNYYKEKNVGY